jgi:hypothetical protein
MIRNTKTKFGSHSEILVEAANFNDYGGWVLDPQFENQMGSTYLLAHGLGRPVKDAKTTIAIPEAGEYNIWVRAKDWVPSHHPGRFTLSINGKKLDTEFGANGQDWMWQPAGAIELPQGNAALVLHDLTGFDGRCDAIFLSREGTVPPGKADKSARAWRKSLLGLPDEPNDAGNFDLVVVGGGVAGCATALAAARLGCRVALIHDTSYLGGNASKEVGIPVKGQKGPFIEELTERTEDGDLHALKVLQAEPNVSLFLEQHVYDAVLDDAKVVSVDARHSRNGQENRFRAPVFADCTGMAILGMLAGATMRYGRESRSEFNESLAPETQDNLHHGNTVLFRTRMADKSTVFPDVPWAVNVAKDYSYLDGQEEKPGLVNQPGPFAGEPKSPAMPTDDPNVPYGKTYKDPMHRPASHFWEYGQSLDPYIDDELIRDHLFRAIYGTFANVKCGEPEKHANLELEWVGHIIARGEYRRLVGDYILTENDIRTDQSFPDTVALNSDPFCIHIAGNEKYDFRLKDWVWVVLGRSYSIPFRCLYSANVSNLMMAGKHISVTHIAGAATKRIGNGGRHGIAVGAAASLCKKYSTTPRGICKEHIQELQKIVKSITD